jgi:hypothetical protein
MRDGHVVLVIAGLFAAFLVLAISGVGAEVSRRSARRASLPRPLRFYRNPAFRPKTGGFFSRPNHSRMIYVAVLDSQHRSSPSQCRLKALWLSNLTASVLVDGAEFYTNHSWINARCGIRPVAVPSPPPAYPVQRESGAWLMFNVLQLFLTRSKAAYLFVIADSAYVRPERFLAWLTSFVNDGKWRAPAVGFCYEIRDYFKAYLTGSGVLLQRSLVEQILRFNETWDVMCRCELRAEEALGHVVMEARQGLSASGPMLGRPFHNYSDYVALYRRDFSGLPACRSGNSKIRACESEPFPLNDIAVWNGVGDEMGIDRFLREAPEMIEGIPDNIGISWTRTHPWLCILSPERQRWRGEYSA